MRNYVANGDSLQLTAPAGGVVSGKIMAQGKIVGVVFNSALEGEQFTLKIQGAYSNISKANTEVWAVGEMLYLKTDGELTKTVGSNTFAGYVYAPAASSEIIGSILLSH